MSSPGLTLGPLDPDASSELTKKVGVHNKATRLLKSHAQNWPIELVNALSLPRDDERSDALDFEEIEDALRALEGRRAFFKEDDEFEDASVRGRTDKERIVSVVFRKPSGRAAYGVIPYAGLEQSARNYEAAVAEAKGLTRPAAVAEGASVDEALLSSLEQAARDAEQAAREAQGALEAQQEELERLRNPEPWAGYDEANGDDVIKELKDGGLDQFGRAGLERIRTYEEGTKKRKGVLTAVEEALESQAPPQG